MNTGSIAVHAYFFSGCMQWLQIKAYLRVERVHWYKTWGLETGAIEARGFMTYEGILRVWLGLD